MLLQSIFGSSWWFLRCREEKPISFRWRGYVWGRASATPKVLPSRVSLVSWHSLIWSVAEQIQACGTECQTAWHRIHTQSIAFATISMGSKDVEVGIGMISSHSSKNLKCNSWRSRWRIYVRSSVKRDKLLPPGLPKLARLYCLTISLRTCSPASQFSKGQNWYRTARSLLFGVIRKCGHR